MAAFKFFETGLFKEIPSDGSLRKRVILMLVHDVDFVPPGTKMCRKL